MDGARTVDANIARIAGTQNPRVDAGTCRAVGGAAAGDIDAVLAGAAAGAVLMG